MSGKYDGIQRHGFYTMEFKEYTMASSGINTQSIFKEMLVFQDYEGRCVLILHDMYLKSKDNEISWTGEKYANPDIVIGTIVS